MSDYTETDQAFDNLHRCADCGVTGGDVDYGLCEDCLRQQMQNSEAAVGDLVVEDVRWARQTLLRAVLDDDALRGLVELRKASWWHDEAQVTNTALRSLSDRVALLDETLADWSNGMTEAERENTRVCLQDALHCFLRYANREPFPGSPTSHPSLPKNYLESALMWANRAGQHAYGFRTPVGW